MKNISRMKITGVGSIDPAPGNRFIFGVDTEDDGFLRGPFKTLHEAEVDHEIFREAAAAYTAGKRRR